MARDAHGAVAPVRIAVPDLDGRGLHEASDDERLRAVVAVERERVRLRGRRLDRPHARDLDPRPERPAEGAEVVARATRRVDEAPLVLAEGDASAELEVLGSELGRAAVEWRPVAWAVAKAERRRRSLAAQDDRGGPVDEEVVQMPAQTSTLLDHLEDKDCRLGRRPTGHHATLEPGLPSLKLERQPRKGRVSEPAELN